MKIVRSYDSVYVDVNASLQFWYELHGFCVHLFELVCEVTVEQLFVFPWCARVKMVDFISLCWGWFTLEPANSVTWVYCEHRWISMLMFTNIEKNKTLYNLTEYAHPIVSTKRETVVYTIIIHCPCLYYLLKEYCYN